MKVVFSFFSGVLRARSPEFSGEECMVLNCFEALAHDELSVLRMMQFYCERQNVKWENVENAGELNSFYFFTIFSKVILQCS